MIRAGGGVQAMTSQINLNGTGWPVKHGRLLKVACPVYTSTEAYTRQVTFYKVPEKHDHF